MNMNKFIKAIILASEIRENSYDKEAARKARINEEKNYKYSMSNIDFSKFYILSLRQSIDKAILITGCNLTATFPIYLLLRYCWNDILDWANKNITTKKEV